MNLYSELACITYNSITQFNGSFNYKLLLLSHQIISFVIIILICHIYILIIGVI